MAFAVDFKITVAGGLIREETDADFKGDELAGKWQQLFLRRRQKTRRGGQISPTKAWNIGNCMAPLDKSRSSSFAGLVAGRSFKFILGRVLQICRARRCLGFTEENERNEEAL
jgi:hypothetical protein